MHGKKTKHDAYATAQLNTQRFKVRDGELMTLPSSSCYTTPSNAGRTHIAMPYSHVSTILTAWGSRTPSDGAYIHNCKCLKKIGVTKHVYRQAYVMDWAPRNTRYSLRSA